MRGRLACLLLYLESSQPQSCLKHGVIMVGMLGTMNGHWIMYFLLMLCKLSYLVMLIPAMIPNSMTTLRPEIHTVS